jgi:hypothetical protein
MGNPVAGCGMAASTSDLLGWQLPLRLHAGRPARAELTRLGKETLELRMGREMLKKPAAFFAREDS